MWSGVGLLAVAATVAIWLFTADLGFLKPRVERVLSELSGREFEIRGDLQIDLGRQAVIRAHDIHWRNADWDEPADMLRVGSVELQFDLWSVVRGPFELSYIEIIDADLVVTRHADGRLNWDIFALAADSAEDEGGEDGMDVLVGQVNVEDVRVVLTSPDRDRPVQLGVDRLAQRRRDDDFLELSMTGTLGERQIGLNGEIGTWQALQAGRDVVFDVEGQLGSLRWAGEGRVDELAAPRRPALNFSATGPSFTELTRMLGLGEEGEGSIDIKAALKPADDGPLQLDVDARIGRTSIQAAGVFSDLVSFDSIDIDLAASGPDLSRVLKLVGVHGVPEGAFLVDVDAKRSGQALNIDQANMKYGDAEFLLTADLPEFPSLENGHLDLTVTGADIERFRQMAGLPGVASGPFSIELDLEVAADGDETVSLDISTELGRLQAGGRLADTPGYAGTRFDYQFESPSAATFAGLFGVATAPESAITANGRLELQEESIRTVGPSSLSLGDIDAKVDGQFIFADRGDGSSARIDVEGPDLAAAVAGFAEVKGLPAQPFEASGRFSLDASQVQVRAFEALIGRTELSIDGGISLAPGLAGSRLTFATRGPAIEDVLATVGSYSVRPGFFSLSGRVSMDDDQVGVEDVHIERDQGVLTLDGELGLPLSRRWANFSASGSGGDIRGLVAGAGALALNEAPFTLKARGTLRGDELGLDQLNLTVGDSSLSAEGQLAFGESAGRTRFSVAGRIPDLAALGTVNERRLNAQRLAWSFNANGNDGRFDIDNLLVELGDSDIRGELTYAAGPVPDVTLTLSSDSLRVAPLLEEDEAAVEPVAEHKNGRLIPDWPLPLDAMRAVNAVVTIDVGKFTRGDLYLENVLLDGSLAEGALTIRELRMDPRAGRLVSRATIAPAEGGAKTSVALVARGVAFGLSPSNRDLARTVDVDLNMTFVGDDLRAMLAGADGVLLMDMQGGRIGNSAFLQAVYGDVLQQILTVVNPFYKPNTTTTLNCSVVPIRIAAGKLTADPPIVVRTDKLNMFVRPAVNLQTEKLDMSVRTMPRKGISISTAELFNPYVKIVGTLGDPALAVDEQGVLITGGAAFATGGLSILAKAAWDRLSRSAKPCEEARMEAQKTFKGQLPDLVVEPRNAAAQAASTGVRQ